MSQVPLEQSELWEITRQLVAFNTVSAYSNTEAAAFLANYLETLGYTVHLLKETVQGVEKAMVVAWAGPVVPNGLIISGHIDVVPFEGQPGWTKDPLRLQRDGDRLYGRGVTDMKAFLAQAILAAKQHPVQTLQRPLMFIFTCDEELAGQGAGRLVHTLPELFRDYPLPEVALIGEPTNFDIFSAHKGYTVFDIIVQGKGGHSSAPHKGVNAIEQMGRVIEFLRATNQALQERPSDENKRLFPEVPASVYNYGIISGGLAANMIAEECRLTVSIRVSPGDQAETLVGTLRNHLEQEILPGIRRIAPDGGVLIERMVSTPAMRSPVDGPFSQFMNRIMGRPVAQGAPYATDGGQFQQIGIHSYICGPGLLEEAHQPDESLPVENFVLGLEKVERIIHEWCVQPE